MAYRVLIAGFKHETNTFSRQRTDLESYRQRGLYRGGEIANVFAGTQTEVAAFLDGARANGWETILPVVADATPSGRLTKECYETIAGEILAAADERPDAVLLNLHGAMVAEHLEDGEGELLRRLREKLGAKAVIAATLDLHANVTEAMARNADILVSYRTYPHIDNYEIASEAIDLVARTLAGEIRPRTYVIRTRAMMGLDSGRTTSPGPMTEALGKAKALMREPGVLSVSVNAGFFKADIAEVGPTAVLVGDGDDDRYAGLLKSIGDHIWETRGTRTIEFLTAADAVARAHAVGRVGSPVVIADYADNPGGGGYSDSTGILRTMIEAGLEHAAISPIFDPESAAACHRAGVGSTLTFDIGGKIDPLFGAPVRATGVVTQLSNGRFTIKGPMMTGMPVDQGPTAAFRIGGIEVVLASRRYQNYDLGFFETAGIDPRARAVLVVKSMQHFRAAYAPIAGEILVVDEGGGVTSNNIKRLPFKNVRRPVYPLDLD